MKETDTDCPLQVPDVLQPLSDEELAKCKPISMEEIEAALEEGAQVAERIDRLRSGWRKT